MDFQVKLDSVYDKFKDHINSKFSGHTKQYKSVMNHAFNHLENGGELNPSETTYYLFAKGNLTNYYQALIKFLDSDAFSLVSYELGYKCYDPTDEDNDRYQQTHFNSLPSDRRINKQVFSLLLYLIYESKWILDPEVSIRFLMRGLVRELVDNNSNSRILKLVS